MLTNNKALGNHQATIAERKTQDFKNAWWKPIKCRTARHNSWGACLFFIAFQTFPLFKRHLGGPPRLSAPRWSNGALLQPRPSQCCSLPIPQSQAEDWQYIKIAIRWTISDNSTPSSHKKGLKIDERCLSSQPLFRRFKNSRWLKGLAAVWNQCATKRPVTTWYDLILVTKPSAPGSQQMGDATDIFSAKKSKLLAAQTLLRQLQCFWMFLKLRWWSARSDPGNSPATVMSGTSVV